MDIYKKMVNKKNGNILTISQYCELEIKTYLKQEIKTYDTYLRGDIYDYKIEKPIMCKYCKHTEMKYINSCGGFFGSDFKTNGMSEHIDDYEDYEDIAEQKNLL